MLGKTVVVASFPRPEDFVLRCGLITFDHGDGTVDVCVFNSATDIREASMPVNQSLQNVPLLEVNAPYPDGYRGRWTCTLLPAETPAVTPPTTPSGTVAKPKPAAKAKR